MTIATAATTASKHLNESSKNSSIMSIDDNRDNHNDVNKNTKQQDKQNQKQQQQQQNPIPPTDSAKHEDERRRFEVELEFVQCLASPSYLNFLAQNEYFESSDFITYLNYLQYWRKPQYARFVVYPHALYFLQMLQDPTFREAIKRPDFTLMVHQQQGWYWQFEKSIKSRSETVNANIFPSNLPQTQSQSQSQAHSQTQSQSQSQSQSQQKQQLTSSTPSRPTANT